MWVEEFVRHRGRDVWDAHNPRRFSQPRTRIPDAREISERRPKANTAGDEVFIRGLYVHRDHTSALGSFQSYLVHGSRLPTLSSLINRTVSALQLHGNVTRAVFDPVIGHGIV